MELLASEEQKLRARYEEQLRINPRAARPPQPIDKEKFRRGLRRLLACAIDSGVLKNENFTAWKVRTMLRAHSRKDLEAIQKMNELGLTELESDSSDVEITDADRDHDYLSELVEAVPLLRNHFAHGTS